MYVLTRFEAVEVASVVLGGLSLPFSVGLSLSSSVTSTNRGGSELSAETTVGSAAGLADMLEADGFACFFFFEELPFDPPEDAGGAIGGAGDGLLVLASGWPWP